MAPKTEFIRAIAEEFSGDRLTYQKRLATFHPDSTEEAARLVTLANKIGQQLYVTGFGNNIDPIGHPFEDLVVVRTDRLNSVLEISESNLLIKVGAGFPLREINTSLVSKGLWMPHASLPYVGSAGGAVAVNLSADIHGADLPIKKYFIQAEIITPEGEIITPGSTCFKSVSGYDIVKIYAPSWGLLGLLVSLTFRVMPISAADEFSGLKMKPVDRDHFLSGLDETNQDTAAVYSRKIKARFDPRSVLPIV